jgi:hypothetical protein
MALVGQGHAFGVTAEQADADFLFQLLDGQGQGGLGNEAACAAAEIEPVSATAMKWRI